MNDRTIIRWILSAALVPMAIVKGTIVMIFLYILPTDNIKENVIKSSSMYDGGNFSFSNWANGKSYTKLSNPTDATMINTALFRPTSSFLSLC